MKKEKKETAEKTPKPLKCKERGCGGTVDVTKATWLKTGCISATPAFMCDKCGRYHWYRDNKVYGVRNRQGKKAFGLKPEE